MPKVNGQCCRTRAIETTTTRIEGVIVDECNSVLVPGNC